LLSYLLDRVSHFRLGLASDLDPPTYASYVARIAGICYHA
jgi:hypothetical protein